MNEAALKTYLRNYEKFMETPFLDARPKKRKNFRTILRDKVLDL